MLFSLSNHYKAILCNMYLLHLHRSATSYFMIVDLSIMLLGKLSRMIDCYKTPILNIAPTPSPPPPPKKIPSLYLASKSGTIAIIILKNCVTVKPPKRGQFGTGGFVLSSEVVLSKRSTILYHIFCINVHIQGTTTSRVKGQS